MCGSRNYVDGSPNQSMEAGALKIPQSLVPVLLSSGPEESAGCRRTEGHHSPASTKDDSTFDRAGIDEPLAFAGVADDLTVAQLLKVLWRKELLR